MTEIPAGWYDDPENATQFRYWDGTVWTDHRSPKSIRPTMANADATAVISRGLDLFKQTWVQQLAVGAIVFVGAMVGVVLAGIGVVTGLDPDLLDILDRVTEPGFDADRNPADQAFLDSITFDWSVGPILLIVVGSLVAGFFLWLGFGTAVAHVASVNAGVNRKLGDAFRYALRSFPRWLGVTLLWGLVILLVFVAIIGLHILLVAVSPALLILLIPLDIGLLIYAWPYTTMMGTALFIAPRDVGPFRRTVALVRPRWPGIAGRVLLVNVVVLAVNIGGNVVALIPILGIVVSLVLSFAVYAYQVCTQVALFEYLEGPLHPELATATQTS